VVPIVPHHEIVIFRNNHRPKGTVGASRLFIVITVLVIKELTIDKDLSALDLNPVPWESDDALDEVLFFVLWINEDDDVPPLGLADRDQGALQIRDLDSVKEFVDQDVIPHQQGRLHGSGRDLEGLNHKRPDEEGKQNRDSGCFSILPDGTLLFYLFRLLLQANLLESQLADHRRPTAVLMDAECNLSATLL